LVQARCVEEWSGHSGYNLDRRVRLAAFAKSVSGPTESTAVNVGAVATRGVCKIDAAKGFIGSYDPYTATGRASAEGLWRFANSRPWLCGGFVWTGFDYRGEPFPYQWPNISSQYGVIDTCGFPKDTFYYFQSWWSAKPVLHIFPNWNWEGLEGQEIAVWVYSNLGTFGCGGIA
jgi:beta-galactosidase